jgi:hypothetical protein
MGSLAGADTASAPFNANPTTGLVNIPIAEVLPLEGVRVGAYSTENSDETGVVAFSPAPRVELGVLAIDRETLTLNGQYLAWHAGPSALAVGVQNLSQAGPDSGPVGDRSLYAVWSQELGSFVRAHGGAGTGRFDGLFGGAEVRLGRLLQLSAEYDGQQTNYGARISINPGAALEVVLVGALLDHSETSLGIELVLRRH